MLTPSLVNALCLYTGLVYRRCRVLSCKTPVIAQSTCKKTLKTSVSPNTPLKPPKI